MPFLLALGATAVVALVAPMGEGETHDPPFRWETPSECPPTEAVRDAVEGHLGLPLEELPLASWSVTGEVSKGDAGGWSLQLSIEVPDGRTERSLHDPHDCAAVSDAAALLIALALDPEAVAAPDRPIASPSEPARTSAQVNPGPAIERDPDVVPPAIEIAPAAEDPPPDDERLRKPLHFVVGMAAGLDYGTLRGVAPIGRASFSWQRPRLRLGATATFGRSALEVPAVAQEVSVWMWAAGVEAGPVFRMGQFEFPLMVGLEAGQLILRPRVLLPPAGHQVTWAAFLLTPSAAWVPRPWVAVVLRAGATVSLVRPEFAVEGIGRIHAPAPVGIRATLGLEFRVPLDVMKTAAGGNSP